MAKIHSPNSRAIVQQVTLISGSEIVIWEVYLPSLILVLYPDSWRGSGDETSLIHTYL